ncbi:MAG: nucleotidyl transferase AbiEii/AbiGii toxin family protein [Deltaproteobacteria bacterium]|nr:nucleotidyl transferase AbiEii/AbiGii toxin family protein [Deltaproteobacteria bacterium]
MRFVHGRRGELADLIDIVADRRGVRRSLVEKDYWVTHALWALSVAGLEVWFKGGTSLSKGFGLIERFSEDLDLKVDRGRLDFLPAVSNWKSEGAKATGERRAFFEALVAVLQVPDCRVALDEATIDKSWRGASFRVTYPSTYAGELPPEISAHILLEVGNARVTPFVTRDISSWVHDGLEGSGFKAEFRDNRARGVRCVHPAVTLLEKLDALHRRFPNEKAAAPTFVRHYDDAARLAAAADAFLPLDGYTDIRSLADEMVEQKQLTALPKVGDAAFTPCDDSRWAEIQRAHAAILPTFWGPRMTLNDACGTIRAWVGTVFP